MSINALREFAEQVDDVVARIGQECARLHARIDALEARMDARDAQDRRDGSPR